MRQRHPLIEAQNYDPVTLDFIDIIFSAYEAEVIAATRNKITFRDLETDRLLFIHLTGRIIILSNLDSIPDD